MVPSVEEAAGGTPNFFLHGLVVIDEVGRVGLGDTDPDHAAPDGHDAERLDAAAAMLAKKRSLMSERLVGDGVVPLDSALGQHPDRTQTLAIPKSRQWVGYGIGHLDLLSHPEVYAQLRNWVGPSRGVETQKKGRLA